MPKKQTLSIQDGTFFVRFCERLESNDVDLKFSAATRRKILDALPDIKKIGREKSAKSHKLDKNHYSVEPLIVESLIAAAIDKDVLGMMSQDERTRFSKMKSAFKRKQTSSDRTIDVYHSTNHSLGDIIERINSVNGKLEHPLKSVTKKQVIDYLAFSKIVELLGSQDHEIERFHRSIIAHIDDY